MFSATLVDSRALSPNLKLLKFFTLRVVESFLSFGPRFMIVDRVDENSLPSTLDNSRSCLAYNSSQSGIRFRDQVSYRVHQPEKLIQWNPVNTDIKGTPKSVRINRALGINVTDTCFIVTKTEGYFLGLGQTEEALTLGQMAKCLALTDSIKLRSLASNVHSNSVSLVSEKIIIGRDPYMGEASLRSFPLVIECLSRGTQR